MQSLDVYKYINTLVRRQRDDLSLGREETMNLNRTFKGSKTNIHVFASHAECLQILKDTSFIQPRIADAIAEVFKSLGIGIEPIEGFLRNNLIDMNGPAHAAARPLFIREYGATQRRLADDLPAISRKAFQDFIDGKRSRLTEDLVEPYVDAIIETIFKTRSNLADVSRKDWTGTSSCVFEYVHSATKLKKKANQIRRLGEKFGVETDSKGIQASQSLVLILTYVLQGRDPLIGAMSAYMHSLIAMNEDERRSSVSGMTARDLFWRTSPVNYIGRIATKTGPVGSIYIQAGDEIVLMLPCANHDRSAPANNSLAFGAGAHMCAGQALALAIGDAWLQELRSLHERIIWEDIQPDRPVTAVFRQYRTQS